MAGIVLSVISFVTVSGCCVRQNAKRVDMAYGETGGMVSTSEDGISVTCNGNPLFTLGAVLAAIHESGVAGIPAVSLFVRDDTVREVPRESRWTSNELVSYYEGVRNDPKHQLWEYAAVDRLPSIDLCVQNMSLDEILRMVCLGVGYSMSRSSDSNRISIGPAELIHGSSEFVRRIYRTSGCRQWGEPEKLPKMLSPCGVACAYDENSGLLILIGERVHLNVFEGVLEVIGADSIGGNDGVEW